MGVFGYLDAGSGSMLVGAVAAGAAGVAVAAKVGWKRVTGVFSRKDDDVEPDESAEDTGQPANVDDVAATQTTVDD
jgi:hypothetical protein